MSTYKDKGTGGVYVYMRLLSYVKPYWHLFAISIFGYMLFAASQPMFPKLVDYFIRILDMNDNSPINIPLIGEFDNDVLLYLVPTGVVVIGIVRGIGSYLGSYYIAKVSLSVIHDLRVHLFKQMVNLPNSYFDNHSSGHLISMITYNVGLVTGAATDAVKVVFREGMTVIALLSFLFWIDWKLTLIFIAVTPMIAMVVAYTGMRFRRLSSKLQTSMGELTHVTSETINSYRVVRSFGGESYENTRFKKASKVNAEQGLKLTKVSAIHTPTLQCLVLSALAVLMYAILYLGHSGGISTYFSELVAYLTAAGLIPKPVRQLSEVNSDIQKGIAAAESIFMQIDEPIELNHGQYSVKRATGRLEFKNITFTYKNAGAPTLENINLIMEPGQTIALVGRSGSGKTTMASLLLRFYEFDEGDIFLDGISINHYDLRNLRSQIALVTQNVSLFNDTVMRNIAYGDLQDQGKNAVITAAKLACAEEFIEKLPAKFSTMVGEDGILLSGGQRQRLAIARGILKNAPVLILDEATSALDSESESHIQTALERVMKGRTTLVIAHRLSTIKNADVILVMEKGNIIERGSHEELLGKKGAYSKLYDLQFKDFT